MSIDADVRTILIADTGAGGAATLLTGGVYSYEQTGRLGINRRSTSNAFDVNGKLKLCAVVKPRAKVPDGDIRDPKLQLASYRQVVEVWVYGDGDAGYSGIDQAVQRIYQVLHGKRAGGKPIRWQTTLERPPRDDTLNEACVSRIDFQILAIQGV